MDLSNEWGLADVLPIIRSADAKYFILNVSNGMMVKEKTGRLLRITNPV